MKRHNVKISRRLSHHKFASTCPKCFLPSRICSHHSSLIEQQLFCSNNNTFDCTHYSYIKGSISRLSTRVAKWLYSLTTVLYKVTFELTESCLNMPPIGSIFIFYFYCTAGRASKRHPIRNTYTVHIVFEKYLNGHNLQNHNFDILIKVRGPLFWSSNHPPRSSPRPALLHHLLHHLLHNTLTLGGAHNCESQQYLYLMHICAKVAETTTFTNFCGALLPKCIVTHRGIQREWLIQRLHHLLTVNVNNKI